LVGIVVKKRPVVGFVCVAGLVDGPRFAVSTTMFSAVARKEAWVAIGHGCKTKICILKNAESL